MRIPDRNDLILPTFVAIFVILIGTLVDQLFGLIGLRAVIIGVTITIIIILGIVSIVWLLGRNSYEADLRKAIEELRDIIPSSRYDWLHTSAEMNKIEEKVRCKDIWVISYDLSNDTTGDLVTSLVTVVKNNLKRNITYTFIVPDTEHTTAVLPRLYQIFSSHPRQLRVIKISQDTFDFFTATHITIYNPNLEYEKPPQVFIELPIVKRGYGKGHWVLVADDIALKVVGRFRVVVERDINV